jgi:hypothetical protein
VNIERRRGYVARVKSVFCTWQRSESREGAIEEREERRGEERRGKS